MSDDTPVQISPDDKILAECEFDGTITEIKTPVSATWGTLTIKGSDGKGTHKVSVPLDAAIDLSRQGLQCTDVRVEIIIRPPLVFQGELDIDSDME